MKEGVNNGQSFTFPLILIFSHKGRRDPGAQCKSKNQGCDHHRNRANE